VTAFDTPPTALSAKDSSWDAARTAVRADEAADQETSDALVRKILMLDDRLARSEDEAVSATIEKGRLLSELKASAKRTWGERLGELGLNPRVARRLMAVGAWAEKIGPIGSDTLRKLPRDPHKLEWLAKLDREQLGPLVERFDCRELPRAAVIKAVKEALGPAKPPARTDGPDRALRAIEKLLDRLAGLLEGLKASPLEAEARTRIWGLLGVVAERPGTGRDGP
jgi:hypothetical protein